MMGWVAPVPVTTTPQALIGIVRFQLGCALEVTTQLVTPDSTLGMVHVRYVIALLFTRDCWATRSIALDPHGDPTVTSGQVSEV